MTVALEAFPAFYDNSGNPLSGGKVYTFTAGTSTPLASYTDRGGSVANANPVVLDSAGRASIWLQTNVAYKIRVDDSAGNVIATVDDFYAGADPAQLTAAGIVPATGGTYTGQVDFTGGAEFNGTAAQDLNTLDTLGIASVQNANLWMNSEFYINQRAVSAPADAAYAWDRVLALCDGGSLTSSTFDTAGLTLGGSAGRIIQPDVAAKRIGFCQIVEAKDVLAYRGKNLVLAAQVRSTSAITIRAALVAWTGAQDAPTRDVVNTWSSTNYTAGNFFVASTSTIAVAAQALSANVWTDIVVSSTSAGGVVAPLTMKNLYMVFWTDSTAAQNLNLDITSVRCGQGTEAPLWTAPSFAVEMLRCQRFLEVAASYSSQYAGAGVTPVYHIQYSVPKRVAPTIGFTGLVNTNSSATTSGSITADGFNVQFTVTALGLGQTNFIWTASADFV